MPGKKKNTGNHNEIMTYCCMRKLDEILNDPLNFMSVCYLRHSFKIHQLWLDLKLILQTKLTSNSHRSACLWAIFFFLTTSLKCACVSVYTGTLCTRRYPEGLEPL